MRQDPCDHEGPTEPTVQGNKQEHVPAHQQRERDAVESPVTQPSSQEDQRHDEQKRYWERQIRISTRLNWISAGGAVIAGFALIALCYQIKMMKTSLQTTERAWVTVKGITIANPLAEGETATIIAGFENSGHSPALQMTVTNAVTIGPIAPLGEMPKFPHNPDRSLATMGPNSKTTVNIRHLVTREDVSNLQAKKAALYSFGIIDYTDIFGTPH